MSCEKGQDIFDIVMSWRGLRSLQPFYRKYKEGILYLFFGGLTFFLSIGVYALVSEKAGVKVLVSNVISWIAGVTFSFFTTKKWVFKVEISAWNVLFMQLVGFYAARIMTLLLQEVLLFIFINELLWNSMIVKGCTEIINIIINYLMSKFVVFKKKL